MQNLELILVFSGLQGRILGLGEYSYTFLESLQVTENTFSFAQVVLMVVTKVSFSAVSLYGASAFSRRPLDSWAL